MDSPFLTIQEVAAHLRVDSVTVRRWCATGALKAVKVGPKVYRVSQADLNAFLARSKP